MFESVFLIIFGLSLGGIAFVLLKKVPALHTMPHHGSTGIKKHKVIIKIQDKVKGVSTYFEDQIIFHKFLSWVKIITLKVERMVDDRLHKIRKKAQEKK